MDLVKFNNLSLRYSSRDFQSSVFQALDTDDDFRNLRMIRTAKFEEIATNSPYRTALIKGWNKIGIVEG